MNPLPAAAAFKGPAEATMCKTNRSGKSTILSKDQIEVFCANLPEKFSLLAELLYFSAGRVKEIASIRVRNLNFASGTLTIEKSSTKTNETRQVPIHPRVLEHLQEWVVRHKLEDADFVFFTDSKNTNYKKGEKFVSTQSIDEYFRKAFDWIGVEGASTHSFRRSRLTHLLECGWNIREIANISGHKSLVSLQQYLDVDKSTTFAKYRELFEIE